MESTAGSERGMGKHACRKTGRCALSLLYGVAAGWATAPPTMTSRASPCGYTSHALLLPVLKQCRIQSPLSSHCAHFTGKWIDLFGIAEMSIKCSQFLSVVCI